MKVKKLKVNDLNCKELSNGKYKVTVSLGKDGNGKRSSHTEMGETKHEAIHNMRMFLLRQGYEIEAYEGLMLSKEFLENAVQVYTPDSKNRMYQIIGVTEETKNLLDNILLMEINKRDGNKYYVVIDKQSYELVAPHKWCDCEGYAFFWKPNENKKTDKKIDEPDRIIKYLHRFILAGGEDEIGNGLVAHHEGHKFDNRVCKLAKKIKSADKAKNTECKERHPQYREYNGIITVHNIKELEDVLSY